MLSWRSWLADDFSRASHWDTLTSHSNRSFVQIRPIARVEARTVAEPTFLENPKFLRISSDEKSKKLKDRRGSPLICLLIFLIFQKNWLRACRKTMNAFPVYMHAFTGSITSPPAFMGKGKLKALQLIMISDNNAFQDTFFNLGRPNCDLIAPADFADIEKYTCAL